MSSRAFCNAGISDAFEVRKTEAFHLMTEFIHDEDNWTLKPVGDINASTSTLWIPDILQKLEENQGQLLVIDLTAVENVDAYGLRLLLTLKKELFLRNIDIELQNPTPNLCRLFKILQFDRTFVIKKAA